MAYICTILPLYYNPGLSPCSSFVLDFYRSETGQRIVIYIKKLYNNYSDFCSIRNLKELMERGNHMVPSLFILIFQEYPESAGRFFRRFNLIALNLMYNKISDYLLDYAADFLLPNWIFLKDWMKGYQIFLESID
ncbi:hypothetical protein RhiirB3_499543 [Rhizophagus irregularis]|nr:hypothetical protein RhiirB3_499543 [Rhizophagus irregularis]